MRERKTTVRDLMGAMKRALGERRRRVWMGTRRAHIEVRQLGADELARLSERLSVDVAQAPSVNWVELNPHTRRLVFDFEPGVGEAELLRLVEDAEASLQIDNAGFDDEAPPHPADEDAAERLLLELLTDSAGFVLGGGLKLSLLRPSSLAGSVAAVTAIVRGAPKLRKGLDERFGRERADLGMNMLAATAYGLAQRPFSSLVDVAHKASLLRENRAQRGVWESREPDLCAEPQEHTPRRAESRPVPLPRGPIEEYADRAWLVSLAGFGVSFLTTRSAQRAVAALFGGLPKPARLGRDVFAAELGRALAARRVLVMDATVLRRLDRIDCLVLTADLVTRDRFDVGEIVTDGELALVSAKERVAALLDPEQPVEIQHDDGWTLGPARRMDVSVGDELAARADELSHRGALVLSLAKDGRVRAVVELRIVPQTGVEELISAAHEADMRVVVATDDDSVLEGLNADDTIPAGPALESGVRRLQREGRAVLLVAAAPLRGMEAADCAVGLVRPKENTPWAAHLLCESDLSDVRFILQACVAAKRVAKQSVNVALGAATVGTLVSAGGVLPMTTRRIIGVVNMATLVAMANGVRTSAALERRALPAPRDRTPWHALDAHGVLERLGSSSRGLTRGEAQYRYRPDPNEKPALVELGEAISDELFNPLAPLLAAGAGLSAVVGSLADATMVGGVVVLNAVAGGVQRFRTERAIRDLSRTSRRKALVRRGGEIRQVDATDLVRGDVVLLSAGDVVPADCRVLEAESLEVDASSLTGESLPVKKSAAPSFDREVADRSSMLFEGTSVASGRAVAVVVATGDATEARRSGPAPAVDPRASGVEQRLGTIIDLTAPIALTAASGLVGAGLLRGRKLSDVLGAGVSLAVASVPEGLPLIATAAQLAAAQRLSRRGALVRNPRSIEALGRVDLLCVDKTGTVTEGRISLGAVTDGTTEEPTTDLTGARLRVLAAAMRATPDPRLSVGSFDPTDAALVRAAQELAITPAYGTDAWQRASELPFEAERGYHAVTGQCGSDTWLSVKGAPEVVLPTCSGWMRDGSRRPLDSEQREELGRVASELARRGLRVLAVAERAVGPDDRLDPSRPVGLAFSGFLAFSDPVRPSAAAALARLRTAGVETIMITGDHPSTAEAIATELSLLNGKGQLTGAELANMNEEELDRRVRKVAVFARLTPSQKVRVVRALQRAGRCVAMVGDGANDAPAIRLANVGIAIGEHSTAAARGAADVVLTDERIETLVDAIVEGRAMWASVRDAVSILVGGNLGEIGFTLSAGLIDGRPPLNARQLLLVNLLTDVAPAMAIALRPPDTETLEALAQEGPDASLGEPLGRDIASRALVTTAGAGAAWLASRFLGSRERASTVGLLALVGTQLGQTLVSGGFSRPVVATSALSAAALALTVQTPGLSHFFGCRPLGPVGWATAVGASTLATAAAVTYPEAVTRVARRLRLAKVIPAQDPAQLHAKG